MKTKILSILCVLSWFTSSFTYASSTPERVIHQVVCSGDQDTVVDGTQYTFTVTNKTLTTEFKGFNGYRKVERETVTHIKTSLDLKGNFSSLRVSTRDYMAPQQKPDGYVKYFRSHTFFSDWLMRSGATLRINSETKKLDYNDPIWAVDNLKFGNCKITKNISHEDVNKYLAPSQD